MKLPVRKIAKWLLSISEPDTETRAAMFKCHVALIVEDSQNDAEILAHLLRRKNWDSRWARNPSEADKELERQKFDLIFMDIVFPGAQNGYDYASRLSKQEKTEDIPLVFITGAPDTLIHTKPGEYLAHIVKPVTEESLHPAIKVANGLNGNKPTPPRPRIVISASVTLLLISAVIGNGIGYGNGWLIKFIKNLFTTLNVP